MISKRVIDIKSQDMLLKSYDFYQKKLKLGPTHLPPNFAARNTNLLF